VFKDDYVQPKLLEFFMELFYQFQSYFEEGNKIVTDLYKNLAATFGKNPQNKTLGLIAKTIGKLSTLAPSFFMQKWAQVFALFKVPLNDSKISDIDLLGEYLDAIGVIISSSHLANSEQCYFEDNIKDLIQLSLKAIQSNNIKGFDLLASLFSS
jgi:lauroyl/myristoyl acyltransferase